jgi:hypothetical protein
VLRDHHLLLVLLPHLPEHLRLACACALRCRLMQRQSVVSAA